MLIPLLVLVVLIAVPGVNVLLLMSSSWRLEVVVGRQIAPKFVFCFVLFCDFLFRA